ncbi:hypothetical protein PP633_01670 [Mycobacteroides abscessus]|nr:hypothetical protein [Mycobacteroides abscessus]MDM2653138.1 hypothetical protein [Mycobacteroides abscessus]MDM2661955.1 hypothetical protein [Mycobacteroides abscessus]MDM2667063.1 hypothetical protein [Mycobacteroides abscessus]MDM2671462.1 hypothetical protein [Mycobacteroides abscessus]
MSVRETWTARDLPVLKAVVDIFEGGDDDNIEPAEIGLRTGFDEATVQQALKALYKHPYLDRDTGLTGSNGDVIFAGEPTGDGLRAAGNWPSPEGLTERLVAALEAASADESREPEERSLLKKTALTLRGAAYQIALAALGGAGGNVISG